MAVAEEIGPAIARGQRFVDAIVAHDWDGVEACFEPDACFRAVVPNEKTPFRERVGGRQAAAQIQRWFGDDDVTELVAMDVEPIADRIKVAYRIHGHDADGWYLVEQVAYATPGVTGFIRMNLVCSGFRPVSE